MSLMEAPLGQGEWILLVEDDPSVRAVASRVLRYSGYYVFEAETVSEALDIFRREGGEFQLILSDLMLPDGRGLDLLEAFRRGAPNLPMLLSTGSQCDDEFRQEVRNKGFHFLPKPYRMPDLLRTVRTAIDAAPVAALLST